MGAVGSSSDAVTVTQERFESGSKYEAFKSTVAKHQGLWGGVYAHLRLPDDVLERLRELPAPRRVLVLAEDWCGDAASLVPILARLADAAGDHVDLRLFKRDENLDIMDSYLTHGGRAIPIAIVYDEDMRELGRWGPRPGPAQALFRRLNREFRAGRLQSKRDDVHKPLQRWYREDRGRHTLDEFLMILERGGEVRG